jgi:hypothetical protein
VASIVGLSFPKDLDVCHSPLSVNDEDTTRLLPAVGAMAHTGTKRLTLKRISRSRRYELLA